MIKRIIFDIDDTLIPSPDYIEGYNSVLKKYNINKNGQELYDIIGKYETDGEHLFYNKLKLLNHINKCWKLNLTIEFLNDYLDMYNNLETHTNSDTINTLKYLSSKYELVALSNWFTDSQSIRLKKLDMLKYFKEIYGADKVPMKPNKESFLSAMGNRKIEECLMIGDNVNLDIKIPNKLGMKTLYLNLIKKETIYDTIDKIVDLKEIL